MTANLLSERWTDLDSAELRLLLDERIGGPGQYRDRSDNPNVLYLPLAGATCRVSLTFRGAKIDAIEPGPAFDAAEWKRISEEIDKSILTGPIKVGREFSFSSFRVPGSWKGERSDLQILPPPDDAPRAPVESAEHPFILEFPMRTCAARRITNHRRIREHRKLTLLLNVLLAGRTSLQGRGLQHFWASVPRDDDRQKISWFQKVQQVLFRWSRPPGRASTAEREIKWVQQFFFAKLGKAVLDELSPPATQRLEEVDAEKYYTSVGHDGKGLRVPADLDDLICCYLELPPRNRAKFDRAAFWMDMASRLWNISMSASFAALVSSVESLTERGKTHYFSCPVCGGDWQHEVPGAMERFRAFFDVHAPEGALRKRRTMMYSLRSGILHGSTLMQLDEDLAFGWDPPGWNERELHKDLWGLTRVALRDWLRSPEKMTSISSSRTGTPPDRGGS